MTGTGGRSGLRWRMLVTLAVVVALPFAFVYALGSVPNVILNVFFDYQRSVLPSYDPLFVGGFVWVILLLQYWLGPRLALGMEHAAAVDESEQPRLHATAKKYAQTYDLPDPTVALVENDAPNAFVAGRSIQTSALVVTEGLLDTLDDDELDAVVAHELAHLRNRDGPLMSVGHVLPTAAHSIAVSAGRWLKSFFGLYDETLGVNLNPWRILLGLPLIAFLGLLYVVGIAFWAVSVLVFYLLSRHREYAADEAAAEATGDPAALASALRTLDEGLSGTPDEDLRYLADGPEALFLIPIDPANLEGEDGWLSDPFPSMHPPTEKRIERLRSLAAEESRRQGS